MDWLKSWLNDILKWFFDWSTWIPKKLWQSILEGLAAFLNALPVPSFFGDAAQLMTGIPSDILYIANVFEIPFGLGCLMSALIARFILRRIPFIG